MLKKLKNKALIWLMGTNFYNYVLIHVIPYVRFTMYYTTFRGWKYHMGYNLLKPGDIILSQDSKKLTTLIIGGDYSHAGLCLSKDGIFKSGL